MVLLDGNQAVIMAVAKLGLQNAGESMLERLQAGIAVMAGLSRADMVREGDILGMVAELVDNLTTQGLLKRPMRELVETLQRQAMSAHMNRVEMPPASDIMLGGMMGALCTMRIREGDKELVNWASSIPDGFEGQAISLHLARITDVQMKLNSSATA